MVSVCIFLWVVVKWFCSNVCVFVVSISDCLVCGLVFYFIYWLIVVGVLLLGWLVCIRWVI